MTEGSVPEDKTREPVNKCLTCILNVLLEKIFQTCHLNVKFKNVSIDLHQNMRATNLLFTVHNHNFLITASEISDHNYKWETCRKTHICT